MLMLSVCICQGLDLCVLLSYINIKSMNLKKKKKKEIETQKNSTIEQIFANLPKALATKHPSIKLSTDVFDDL